MELKTEACKKVFAEMKDAKDVWKYFLMLLETPRPSEYTEKVVQLLVDIGKELGLETIVDDAKNVLIRKPAFPGYENKPTVCLQGHTDIVYQKVDDLKHEATKDPIVPRIDGEYLKASGTSLGSDDGIGDACILAILADKTIKHGPIEALFTSDEEIGLIGAGALKPGFLKSKYMINVDSEEEFSICVGCAGGMETDFDIPIVREAANGVSKLRILFNDCQGGHTGCDITCNRANPIKMAARVMKHAEKEFTPLLITMEGGTADNAIPRSLYFEVAVKKEQEAAFKQFVESEFKDISAEHKKTDPRMSLKISAATSELAPMTADSTLKLIDFLNVVPFGVLRMSLDVEGLVETSFAVTIVKTQEKMVQVIGSGRSSSGTQMKYLEHQLRSICRLAGISDYKIESPYPGWQPVMDSQLLKTAEAVHEAVLGKKPAVYAIHAGLECGIIMQHYPDMEAISIGPELHNPHSPDEELLISSVPRTYKFLAKTLEKLVE